MGFRLYAYYGNSPDDCDTEITTIGPFKTGMIYETSEEFHKDLMFIENRTPVEIDQVLKVCIKLQQEFCSR